MGHGWGMAIAEGTEPTRCLGHRAIRWILESRQTGRLTVAQWPNIPLCIFVVLTVGSHIIHTTGGAGNLIRVLADGTLLVWAADELVRGVNPFRRILGVLVIAVTIYSLTG
jgi:hypothetical protein